MGREEIIVGLDIGTKKVCTIIGEGNVDETIEIIGLGVAPSSGVKRGIIVDLDQAIQAVKQSIENAERMAGVKVKSAFISIAGSHINSINSKGVIAISEEDPEITEKDIEKVMEAAKAGIISPDRELIHTLSREFIVDGQSGITDPLGMTGARLECKVHIITGSNIAVQNLIKCIEGVKIDINEIIFNPLASSNIVLSDSEKELGALLIDIGGGTTELAIFFEGALVYSAVLPLGGGHITNDLAIGLRTTLEEAERIKINYGSAIENGTFPEKTVEVSSLDGSNKYPVQRTYIIEIIEPRVSEIFNLVKNEVRKSGYFGALPAGITITGGSSLLPGVLEISEKILKAPSRLGKPQYEGELAEMVNDPAYSTALGLLNYGTKDYAFNESYPYSTNKPRVKNVFEKAINWLKDFF